MDMTRCKLPLENHRKRSKNGRFWSLFDHEGTHLSTILMSDGRKMTVLDPQNHEK